MVLLPKVFVPSEAETSSFDPIPAGWYEAEIIKSALKDTNDKQGKYISFVFRVLDGEHKSRQIFANLNIVNKSEIAVKIANGDLKAICKAVGLNEDEELEDTVDLHNIPMAIKVTVKAETAQWPAKNEIKGYKSLDDSPLD
ncbi:MAG: hypothetical protein DRQ40_05025 [Gammaproteobacteria bacterium]|nr:MAG: hypothetical protein DRQ40_05025 [Gammaproteobacteria bacterium]